jgi:hypothetical protein
LAANWPGEPKLSSRLLADISFHYNLSIINPKKMKEPIEIIQFVKRLAYNLTRDLGKHQDVHKRFAYCVFLKQYKSFVTIDELFPKLETNPNHEFSLGIILRSMLMDCILIQHLRFLVRSRVGQDEEETKKMLYKSTYSFIADGTKQIMQDIELNPTLDRSQKDDAYRKLTEVFPDVFELRPGTNPRLKSSYTFNLAELHKSNDHPDLMSRVIVYDLYSFYSKYDHISHWTSVFTSDFPFEKLRSRIVSSVAMILMNIRDLIIVGGMVSEELAALYLPYVNELDVFMKEMSE